MKWPLVDLFDFCQPKQWPTISKRNLLPSGYPVYGANGQIGHYSEYNHEKRTILITCRGATCGSINVCEPKSYVTGNAMALDCLNENRMDFRFLVHALLSANFSNVITGVAQPQITRKSLARLRIPLPPLAEQKRVARILDAADALRAKRRESLAQLDTLLQSTFLDMFGDPVTNPMGWKEKAIEEIVNNTKLGLVRSSENFGWEFSTPYVRMDAVTIDGKFLPEKVQFTDADDKEKENFALCPGDVLFNTRNSKELVGKLCVFPGPRGWLFNNNLMRIRFRVGIEPTVVATQFQFQRAKRELESRKSGTTSVFAVYWKSLRTLPVLVPPLDLQRSFAAVVKSVEQQKSQQHAHLAELDTLFASLQQRAFNGEL